ncbi:MAG: insulinase family protein [Muribaculaceae bacterium]|nr:insulinase family protein [Muribaculaceae bacterium]
MRPQVKEFEDLQFKMPRLVDAGRGIPLYVYDGSIQNVSRIDLIFQTGAYEQSAPLVAQAAAEALTEASEKKSFGVVSELMDFYGGWLRKSVSLHYTIFTLYSPNRTYKKLLPLFFELITSPRFSKKDLERFKRQGRESLKVNQKKVESISSTIFKSKMFGSHPYGVTPTVEDYDALCVEAAREYASERFVAERCQVILSGDVDEDMIALLVENLQRVNSSSNIKEIKHEIGVKPPQGLVVEEVKNALQSSVRIGARTINRGDENYMNLHILNSVLGGYFGSRLNKNIREEKGYTYGINSWLIGLPDAAYFTISSHTAIRFTKPLIDEVKNEIEKIKTSLIPEDELQILKGFLLGDFARMFDNAFTLADNFIAVLTNDVPMNYYDVRIEHIKKATPEILLQTAQMYLPKFEDMTIVVAGGIE